MSNIEKYRKLSDFLASVEACCCARNKRTAFWYYLPLLLERYESDDGMTVREAIDFVVSASEGVQS